MFEVWSFAQLSAALCNTLTALLLGYLHAKSTLFHGNYTRLRTKSYFEKLTTEQHLKYFDGFTLNFSPIRFLATIPFDNN